MALTDKAEQDLYHMHQMRLEAEVARMAMYPPPPMVYPSPHPGGVLAGQGNVAAGQGLQVGVNNLKPMTASEVMIMNKALGQLGTPQQYNHNRDEPRPLPEIFAETVEWHQAAIDVWTFLQAQANMDLFKANPKAKEIYERVMREGYNHVINQALEKYK